MSFLSKIYNKPSYWTYVVTISALGWLAFIFSISSVASTQWVFYGGNKSEGLFNGVEEGQLFPVERSTWLDAVSALYTIGVITNGICMIGMHIAVWKKLPFGLHALAQLFMTIAGNFEMIGCSIYMINVINGYSGSGNQWKTLTITWGYGYAAGWFTAGLCLLNNIIYYLFVQHLKEVETAEET